MLIRVNVFEPPDSRLALPDMPRVFDFRHGQVCSEDSVQLAVVLSAASAACKPGVHHAAFQCCAVSWLSHDSFPLLKRSQWHCCSSLQVSMNLVCISESMLMSSSWKLLTPQYEHRKPACTVRSLYSLGLCSWHVYEFIQPCPAQENAIAAGKLELTSVELVACTS